MSRSRILVLEGVPGVGKSTLADALLRKYVSEQPAGRVRTFLHLTQAHTYGPLAVDEDRGVLTREKNLGHLEAVVSSLEWHARAVTREPVPKFFALVETLHLTHCQRPGVLRIEDAAAIDRRLAALGTKLLFLAASAETIGLRGVVTREDTPFITDYACRKFGPSRDAILRHFVAEQEAMQADLAMSHLDHRVLWTDDVLATYVDEAYDFWLA